MKHLLSLTVHMKAMFTVETFKDYKQSGKQTENLSAPPTDNMKSRM